MNNNIKLIHVGFPKCGSTFLQAGLFSKVKAINAITVGGKNCIVPTIFSYLVYCPDPYYDQQKALKDAQDIDQDVNVLSNEGFTAFVNPELIADRLKKTFGDTKILIVLRNQKSILLSHYLHDIKIGYIVSFDKWLDIQYARFRTQFFQYSHTINAYKKQFGDENVKVLLFEELFKEEATTEIIDFIDLPNEGMDQIDYNMKVNAAHSPLALYFWKFVNCHFGSKANYGAGYMYQLYRYRLASKVDKIYSLFCGKKKIEYYNEEILAKVYEWYHEDNKKLNEIMGRDLSEFGYI